MQFRICLMQDWDTNKGEHVKHYRIKMTENGQYYITTSHFFHSLQDLVEAYGSKILFLFIIKSFFLFSYLKRI